jgi:hypothetical protein
MLLARRLLAGPTAFTFLLSVSAAVVLQEMQPLAFEVKGSLEAATTAVTCCHIIGAYII